MAEEYTVPSQVQEKIDEAESLQKSLQPSEQEDGETKEVREDGVELTAEDDAPGQTTEPVEDSKTTEEPKPEDFEQKYKVLKGKYDSEIQRYTGRVRELENTVRDLQRDLTAKRQEEVKAPAADASDIDVEKYGDYGEEIKELAAQVKALKDENKALKVGQEKLGKTTEQVEEARFFNAVSRLKPDWRQIDDMPEWDQWLEEPCPITKAPKRRLVLKAAFDERDAPRVVALFKQFQLEKGISTVSESDPVKDKAKTDAEQRRLSKMAPETSSADAPPRGKGRMWTRTQIRQFYEDGTKGVYTPEEYAALDRDITRAQSEGRIRPE